MWLFKIKLFLANKVKVKILSENDTYFLGFLPAVPNFGGKISE
jgi:hypothetical protein